MRTAILSLCIVATAGLCSGAACTLGVIDSDEFPMVPMVGAIALVALLLIWMGFALVRSGSRSRLRAGFWCLITSAVLSWVAFALGVKVSFSMMDRYGYLSSGLPLMIWIVVFLLPGVLPATAVAFQVVNRRLWTGSEHLEVWEREDR